MSHVCPKCGRSFELESPYCPACGAPMGESTMRSEHNRRVNDANPALLPLKWHNFLKFVSLPLSAITLIIGLIQDIPNLLSLDPALYYPEMLPLVRVSLLAAVLSGIISLALIVPADILLFRLRWAGTRLVLANYLFQFVYGAFNVVLFFLSPRPLEVDMVQLITSALGMLVMFFITNVYYGKRRGIFHPNPELELRPAVFAEYKEENKEE